MELWHLIYYTPHIWYINTVAKHNFAIEYFRKKKKKKIDWESINCQCIKDFKWNLKLKKGKASENHLKPSRDEYFEDVT